MRGFTLIELLIGIAIVAVMTAVAVPSYRYITTKNSIASANNALLGDFMFARSEAIKRGQTVSLCAWQTSATVPRPHACGTDWAMGWLVFADPLGTASASVVTPLRLQGALRAGGRLDMLGTAQGGRLIQFNREGFAANLNNALLFVLNDASGQPEYTRCLTVNLTGQVTALAQGAVNEAGQACK
jgi:type IV fimbrial biogenesis protein FimT